MDILASLNPQQRVAVEHGNGPALVLAGAGSGKTRVITHRIAYLIRNSAARPENILAVTFTNKAAEEMRGRVHALLGPARSAEPLVSTFHSFCVRLLRREIQHLGFRRDFSIYDADDQLRLIKQILEEIEELKLKLSPGEIRSRISYAKNHGVRPEQYADRFSSETAEALQQIYARYNARLRQANSLDFDDLLLMAVAALEKKPELRRYYSDWYRYILVDEYQDTNRPQYELLRLLTAVHDNLFVVGDEDQSIYKFRGADIQNILRFEKDFPGARIIKLEQNYRSTQNILSIAGAVVENNRERKGKTLWTENVSGDVATCQCADSARKEAEWVSGQIRSVLEENPDYHIAVLYRANFISRNFEEVLTENGVPYALVGSVAFFGRMEVKDLLAYLRLVFNPEDDVAFLRIINNPPRGIGAATVDMLTRAALDKGVPISQIVQEMVHDSQLPARTSRAISRFRELMDKWAGLRDNASMASLLKSILQDVRYKEMLQKQESAEKFEDRMANIEELIRAAEESESRGETISEFLDRAALATELDHLDPNARVTLLTLHSAKGLEFDAVFLAGMEEGLFPHARSLESSSDLEEERRLCYVGITRARRKLFLTWTPFRRGYAPDSVNPSKPSRFLQEMPRELIEGLDDLPSRLYEAWDRKSQHFGRLYEEAEEYESDSDYEPAPGSIGRQMPAHPKSIAELRTYLKQQQSREKSAQASKTGTLLKAGVRVRHKQFGEGIILSRERVGNDIKLTIAFSRAGRKSLIERYAKLEKVSG